MKKKTFDILGQIGVREAAKKLSPLMARPIRWGGGKGRALKEKGTFFLLPFKNYFTLDNLSKYGHITLKFIGRYFYWVLTIFSKKLGKKKKLSKSVSSYLKTIKAIKPKGGG